MRHDPGIKNDFANMPFCGLSLGIKTLIWASKILPGVVVGYLIADYNFAKSHRTVAARSGPADNPTYAIKDTIRVGAPSLTSYADTKLTLNLTGIDEAHKISTAYDKLIRAAQSPQTKNQRDALIGTRASIDATLEALYGRMSPDVQHVRFDTNEVLRLAHDTFSLITGKPFPNDGNIFFLDQWDKKESDTAGFSRYLGPQYVINVHNRGSSSNAVATTIHEMGHIAGGVAPRAYSAFPSIYHRMLDRSIPTREEGIAFLFEFVGDQLRPGLVKPPMGIVADYYMSRSLGSTPNTHQKACALIHAWLEETRNPSSIFRALVNGEPPPASVLARIKRYEEAERVRWQELSLAQGELIKALSKMNEYYATASQLVL